MRGLMKAASRMVLAASLLVCGCCGSLPGGDDEEGKVPASPPAPLSPAPSASEGGSQAPDSPAQALNPFAKMAEQLEGKQAPGPRNMAHGMEAMAQGLAQAMQAMGQATAGQDGKPVKVVGFEQLLPLLPKPGSGWTADEPHGETNSFGTIRASKVRRTYRSGKTRVKIEIVDSSFNPMALQAFRMVALMSESSTEGFKRGTTINGQIAMEEWRKGSQRAEVTAMVANRFIVKVEGRPFTDASTVKAFLKAIDLRGLAALVSEGGKG